MQFHHQVYSAPPRRHFVANTADVTKTSANKPNMAIFSAEVVLTARTLMATAGNSPALIIGFWLGWSIMNSAIGGLTL